MKKLINENDLRKIIKKVLSEVVDNRFTDMDGNTFDVGARVQYWPTKNGYSWEAVIRGIDIDGNILMGDERHPVSMTQEEAKKSLKVKKGWN